MENQQLVVKHIKQWLDLEQKISAQSKLLRDMRKEKKELSVGLMEIMKNNEIDCFDCNSGQLMYTKNNVKKSINKKYLSDVLHQYFQNSEHDHADKLCDFIMDNRSVEVRENIKLKKNKI